MSKPPTISVEDVKLALKKFKGLQYLAAEAIGCEPSYITYMLQKHPELKEFRDACVERRLDVAELKLAEIAEREDISAIKYLLSTRGKHRGYGEKSDQDKTNQPDVLKLNESLKAEFNPQSQTERSDSAESKAD